MNQQLFGSLVAAAVASLLTSSSGFGANKTPPTAANAGKCVHNCAGYAACKGNGNNSCKGKNDCANTGLVPKECSSQATESACQKVTSAKKALMCTWYPAS